MNRIISILLCALVLFSLVGCKGKQKVEDMVEETTTTKQTTTEKTTTTTTLPTTTKEMVTLLSCCPTFEEYIDKLDASSNVTKIKEAQDGRRMIASVDCGGSITATISYLKDGTHNINSITFSDITTYYSATWSELSYETILNLAFLFLDDVPTALDSQTLDSTLANRWNFKEQEYIDTADAEYVHNGVEYGLHINSPKSYSKSRLGSIMFTVEIDENYMVTK